MYINKPSTKKRALLVEDDDAYRYVLIRAIEARGDIEVVDVRLAMDGLDLLEADTSITRAVIDLHMPANTLTGLGLARMLKFKNKRLKVVLITGHPEYLGVEGANQFGGIIFKHPDVAVVAAEVRARLDLFDLDTLPG